MSENTGISWTDATFNPWWGCAKVSPACDNCYAERDAKRFAPGKVLWGVGAERRTFGAEHWQQPLKWAKRAFVQCPSCGWRGMHTKLRHEAGNHRCPSCGNDEWRPGRMRVFCASMGDWLDLDAPIGEFVRLLDTIRLTPELDWLLLSKRIGNWRKRLNEAREFILSSAVVDMALVEWIEAWTAMLGPIDLSPWLVGCDHGSRPGPGGAGGVACNECGGTGHGCQRLHWVIAGGESGPGARPMHPDWARSLRDQCAAAGVPFHFKQWGEWAEHDGHKPTRVFSMDSDIGETLAGRCDGFITKAGEFVRDMDDATSDEPYRGMVRVGKKAAGRLLDGVEHNGFPEVAR
jgi:protein gp37